MGKLLTHEERAKLRLEGQRAARLIRSRDGISQARLAWIAGTSQQVISLIEHGRPRAPYRVLRMLITVAGLIEQQDQQRTSPPPAPAVDHAVAP